jgi:predicted permease
MFFRLLRRLRALVQRPQLDRDLDGELQLHLEREIARLIASGMDAQDARLEALRGFGGIERAREECRDARGVRLLEEFWQDVHYGVRTFLARPGFTLILIFTLAVGIASNAAIFTVVNGVLLKSLPFHEPDQLVVVSEVSKDTPVMAVAHPNYLDWKNSNRTLENMAALLPAGGVLTGHGEPERVIGRYVTASFFPTLGIQPAAGRFFGDVEDRPGGQRVIVLNYGLWQRSFAARFDIIGKPVRFNGERWTIIGVMPAQFDYYGVNNRNNDFFIPLEQLADQPFMGERSSHPLSVIGRLKPGVTLAQAKADLRAIADRLATQYPDSNEGNSANVKSFMEDYVGDAQPALLILSVAVVIVLLISCANVANLLLARAAYRRKEIALRLALGAGRIRIIRQLLTESLLLTLAGGVLGLLLAGSGVYLLLKLEPESLPRVENISLDWRTVAFTALATLITGVIFGLIPAMQTSRTDFTASIKEGAGRTTGSASGWLRNGLIIGEVGLALVLLVGAGLLIRSFWRLMNVDPGFDSHNVLTLRLRLPNGKYLDGQQCRAFLEEVQERVKRLPGVEHVALSTGFPLARVSEKGYMVEGQPEPQKPGDWAVAELQTVSEDYHRVFGIGLVAGRYFNEHDRAMSPNVAIVDETLVRRHFPQSSVSSAIGKRIKFGGRNEPWREIVGVVRHTRQRGLTDEGQPGMYQPWTQIKSQSETDYLRAMDVVVKTTTSPLPFINRIRSEVQAVDKDQPLGNVQTLETMVSDSIAPRRFSLLLLGVFAGVALLLGICGLYGVLSYVVSQRSREIGIRMALGARAVNVLALIIRYGLGLTLAGVVIGLVVAYLVGGLFESLLFGVTAKDPITFVLVPLVLVLVALVACYIPARRATKVDPLAALRFE